MYKISQYFLWKDLSSLCQLLIWKVDWRANWWRHKWFNDHYSKCRQKSGLALKGLKAVVYRGNLYYSSQFTATPTNFLALRLFQTSHVLHWNTSREEFFGVASWLFRTHFHTAHRIVKPVMTRWEKVYHGCIHTRTKSICWKSKKCVYNGRSVLDLSKLGAHGRLG